MDSLTQQKKNNDSEHTSEVLIQPIRKFTDLTAEGYDGLLIDNVFFPICADCQFGIQAGKHYLVPSLLKLMSVLSKCKIYVAKNRYYCSVKRTNVGFPKKTCPNKKPLNVNESFMLYVRRQKWKKKMNM